MNKPGVSDKKLHASVSTGGLLGLGGREECVDEEVLVYSMVSDHAVVSGVVER